MKKLLAAILLLASFKAYAAEPFTFFAITGGQALAYTATSLEVTEAIGAFNNLVRLVCSTNCFVAFGISGVTPHASSTTGTYLPANIPEYFRIDPSSTIAVVRNTSDGTLYVLEVGR